VKRYSIAVIPGDGIGKEVMPEGIRVLNRAADVFGFFLDWHHFDWSCETWHATGAMMPTDGIDRLSQHDAIYLGAVGYPGVPDHVSLWGLLIPIRREFDQYVNLRPVRLLPGINCPLKGKQPGDVDFWVVRENTEGEYSRLGGRTGSGENEAVIQTALFTRRGTDRILRYAFDSRGGWIVATCLLRPSPMGCSIRCHSGTSGLKRSGPNIPTSGPIAIISTSWRRDSL